MRQPGEHRIFVRTEDRSAVADAEIVKAFFESHGQVLDVYKPGNSPDICYVTLSSQAEVNSALAESTVLIGQAMCNLQQAVPRGSSAPPPIMAMGGAGMGDGQINNRLFVTGLDPERVDEEVLRTYFGYFGSVMDVYMPVDRTTNRKKPFAFVTMSTNEELAKVLSSAQHNLGDGHTVNVTIAMPRDDKQVFGGGFDPSQMAGMQGRPAGNGLGTAMGLNGGMCGFEDPFGMAAEDPSSWGAAPQQTDPSLLVTPEENAEMSAEMAAMQQQMQQAGATPAFGSSFGSHRPTPMPGTRLFVFGLPEGLNADMLRGHFWRHGELKDVYIPPRTPDIAYITFSQPAELQAALQYSGLRIAGFWVKGMKPAEDRCKGAGDIPARSGCGGVLAGAGTGGCGWGMTAAGQAAYTGPAGSAATGGKGGWWSAAKGTKGTKGTPGKWPY